MRQIFIVGTGRSGTCWLGDILGTHPEITSLVEPPRLFDHSINLALKPSRHRELYPKIRRNIKRLSNNAKTKYIAFKVHPMLWFASALECDYSDALFIATSRCPHACVASMMKHWGVAKWCRNARKYKIPNEFLGVDRSNSSAYLKGYTLAERCVCRWISHQKKVEQLKQQIKKKLYVVRYENLVFKAGEELKRIQRFLKLERSFKKPRCKKEPIERWKKELSKKTVRKINNLLKEYDFSQFVR